MKTITTKNKELLLVKVPRDATKLKIYGHEIYYNIQYDYGIFCENIKLPSGNYQIVNTLSNITEDECKELVEKSEYHEGKFKHYFWDVFSETALESFHSLMAANGIEGEEYLILKNR